MRVEADKRGRDWREWGADQSALEAPDRLAQRTGLFRKKNMVAWQGRVKQGKLKEHGTGLGRVDHSSIARVLSK